MPAQPTVQPARLAAHQNAHQTAAPRDQAHGLRQLFGGAGMQAGAHGALCFVPLVHNPHVDGVGAVMERLCAAFAAQGRHTLVVDAADSASRAHELAGVDLSACIEPLSAQVSFLAARGLAMNYLDNRATLAGFLAALRTAAPRADVVLLHAGALDLRRMFSGQVPSPLLLASNRPDSLTHAYTSMKLLCQRLGALAYDLVIAGDLAPRRAQRIAARLTECADHFLGAALRHVAVLDPASSTQAPLAADVVNLALGQTAHAPTGQPAAAMPTDRRPPPQAPSEARWAARQTLAAGHLN